MQSVTFVDGHSVRHAVTRVHRVVRRASINVQDSLPRHVHGGRFERLKHGLRHALSVSLGVQRSFRGQNGMFFRRNPEFVVKRVTQDFLQFVTIPSMRSICIPPGLAAPQLSWWARSTPEVDR